MDETTSKCKFCGEKIFSPEEACPHCGKYEKGRQIITQSGWSKKFEPKEPVIGDGWYLYDHAKEDKKQFPKNMECICELLRQGEIDSSVLVCSTEDMEWKPLGKCEEFQEMMKILKLWQRCIFKKSPRDRYGISLKNFADLRSAQCR